MTITYMLVVTSVFNCMLPLFQGGSSLVVSSASLMTNITSVPPSPTLELLPEEHKGTSAAMVVSITSAMVVLLVLLLVLVIVGIIIKKRMQQKPITPSKGMLNESSYPCDKG